MAHRTLRCAAAFAASVLFLLYSGIRYPVSAALSETIPSDNTAADTPTQYGGGYAAAGDLPGVGYTTEVYDAANGLPTSDAMFLLGASDGHIWIGGNSGVIRYDGSTFESMDSFGSMTNARCFFEDSRGRIWVGTNDNGVVVIDGSESTHITYKDGLPSSSIRIFAEDKSGNIFIGTTTGICYADTALDLHDLADDTLSDERILKLDTDPEGRIYGQTTNGIVFAIDDRAVTEIYTSKELATEKITTLLADKEHPGNVYIGTENSTVYYGKFGDRSQDMKRIYIPGLKGDVHWLNYDCGRVWVSSKTAAGFLDDSGSFSLLEDIPIDSGIEMIDSDYQGNLWIASSTEGVMKLVTNNFVDVTSRADLPEEVTNAVYLSDGRLYIGTDNGLRIIDKNGSVTENDLTEYMGSSRIRCFTEDSSGNLWIASYTNDLGLVCYSSSGEIKGFTTQNGMPDDQVRCVYTADDGSIIAGTDGGIAVIRGSNVIRSVGNAEGMNNTTILSVAEAGDGSILAGSDGDGIYVIDKDGVSRLGRDDGLTSDVVSSITKDDERGVIWIVTSNSIEYMKNGRITPVTSFPYSNNYSVNFDDSGNAWVLSSCGVFVVDADDMLSDNITDHSVYTIENGLPYAVTANPFAAAGSEGDLYIPGRNGVIKVNMERFYEKHGYLLTDVSSVLCDEKRIYPDDDGVYDLPSSRGRIQITASVMDYTMLNPIVHIFLEDGPDDGITVKRSDLFPLEYTNLPYGDYKLHIQVIDKTTGSVIQDTTFRITKDARFGELLIIRILLLALLALLAGFIVWRIMRSTVVARQYEEIRRAKEEAERSNTAQSRFLANMSHEIITPINTIIGMNEMAMREDAAGVPKNYFMSMMNYAFDIRKASESLLGLIDDILDISKIESGKMYLVQQEYDVQELLRSVVSIIRIRSSEKGLAFEVNVDEILPRCLFGDAAKIKQIVLNFLTNAVKHTNTGGLSLTVSMEERGGETASLRFSVKDTGTGIKKSDMDNLFSEYSSPDTQISSGVHGTALGLDISRRFAELMNGKIECSSVYGEGSEFTLTLKQKIVDDTPVGEFTERAENAFKGRYIPQFIAPDADVLVIDDSPVSLSIIKGFLRETRVFVTTAQSCEDALDLIRDSHFDVVFLDLVITDADGSEVIGKIREYDKDLPVYALTSNTADGEDFYKSKGYTGYLTKPIDGDMLEKTIMRHLPEKMIEQPRLSTENSALTELPAELKWLLEVPGLSAEDGIRNSAGVEQFIISLDLFFDTIDGCINIIRKAYESGDLRLFTVKVRALRVSANFIGAAELSDFAEAMETAGKQQNTAYINDNIEKLLSDYAAFKEKLSALKKNEDK